MAKRVAPDDIKQFHSLYKELKSYKEVALRTGFSASTVSRYINPNRKDAPRMAIEVYKELLHT